MGVITGDGSAQGGLGGAAGFGEIELARNDAGATAIDTSLVFQDGFSIGGVSYASDALFVSTDGFISFGAALVGLPSDPAGEIPGPFVAAFLADIDTRLDGEGAESGPIWVDVDAINDVVTITWQEVGFYRRNADLTNTFQIQLFDRGADGMDVVLRFDTILWTAGDLEGGWAGNGGLPAFVGYRFAAYDAATALPASRDEAALLDLPSTLGNTGVAGMWVLNVPILDGGPTTTGTMNDDLLLGSDGPDTMWGYAGNDTLIGDAGADVVNGGDGFDWISYATANAGLYFSFAAPHLNTGHAAGDQLSDVEGVIGSTYSDTLIGSAGNDSIIGAGGADILQGGAGQDALWGDAGNDTLMAGAGSDTLYGGDGFDWASYEFDGAITLDLQDQTLASGAAEGDFLHSIEAIMGGGGDDQIAGDAGQNNLDGNAGHDWLHGRGGDDTLFGDAGNDTLEGGLGADMLAGGDGFDFVSYATATAGLYVDLITPALNTGDAGGDEFHQLEGMIGTDFNDHLAGTDDSNWIETGKGDDTLYGRGGDDTLSGGNGNDLLYGGAGADAFYGGAGYDSVSYAGTDRGLIIHMSDANRGSNIAHGDTFSGIENIIGTDFPDLIWGDGAANRLDGAAGADCLFGGAGHDTLIGYWGADVLFGDSGNDVLIGGVGNDLLEGGTGSDQFVHSGFAGDGTDWIIDFTSNAGDVLVLTEPSAQIDDFTITAETRARLWVTQDDVWVVRQISTGRTLWIIENPDHAITDVDIMLGGVLYDLL